MRRTSKHSQLKKTPAGESGSASSTPLPDPGTVNTDPAGAYYMTYKEQIKSPQWQKKRLEILERDKFTCQNCGSKNNQLHVHHLIYYPKVKIWDYLDLYLITLCADCHDNYHKQIQSIHESIVSLMYNFTERSFTINEVSKMMNCMAIDINLCRNIIDRTNKWDFDKFYIGEDQ